MASLLGARARVNRPSPPQLSLRIQTSLAGKPIPICYGQMRLAPNLIWYGDFTATPVKAGKGGKGGGGSGKAGGSSAYQYSAYLIMALCEGPIAEIPFVWLPGTVATGDFPTGALLPQLTQYNMTPFLGAYNQDTWGWTVVHHPEQAVSYHGIAYISAGPAQLGESPALPNFQFETVSTFAYNGQNGVPDADPTSVIYDFLTNPFYGCGFPSAYLAPSWADYQAMCISNGMQVSDAITSQVSASQYLQNLLDATNSEFVWSSGKLKIVPYGDSGPCGLPASYLAPGLAQQFPNGISYAPNTTPIVSLTDDDFMKNSGTSSQGVSSYTSDDPVVVTRKRRSDAYNDIKVEYLARYNLYDPTVVELSDEAAVYTFGLRPKDTLTYHFFTTPTAAVASAALQLRRQQVLNTYVFTVDQRFIFLDPMDLIEISDPEIGSNIPVLIKEITENQQDGTLTFVAEEWLGTASQVPLYNVNSNQPFIPQWNALADGVTAAIFWEAPLSLAGEFEVWIAASSNKGNYGGCEIWVSQDNEAYTYLGDLEGNSLIGSIAAPIPAFTPSASGPTIDSVDTLSVDMTDSGWQPLSTTLPNAIQGNTLCLAGYSEYLAFTNSVYEGNDIYNLTGLVRGMYGSTPVAHGTGDPFVQLIPGTYYRMKLTSDRVGQQFYFKFLGKNIFGGGIQSLDNVPPYSYVTQGYATSSSVGGTFGGTASSPAGVTASSPPADPTNLTTSYVGGQTYLKWDAISDPRPVTYEIRKGDDFSISAFVVGTTGSTTFLAQGDDNYWVASKVIDPSGRAIYDLHPPSIEIVGSIIIKNIVASWDEGATGWTGTFGGSVAIVGSWISTTDSGNILSVTDLLNTPNIFAIGSGGQAGGSYEIPASHQIQISSVTACNVLINFAANGIPVGQNILTITDWLGTTDILGHSVSKNVGFVPQIALSQDGTTWCDWQNYVGGAYKALKFKARMLLNTSDPQAQAVVESFTFAVDVPTRIDHYIDIGVPTSGKTVVFALDGTTKPVPFNGGPGSGTVPSVQGTLIGAQSGDQLVISNVTLSGCLLEVLNGGVGVARTVNLLVEGF